MLCSSINNKVGQKNCLWEFPVQWLRFSTFTVRGLGPIAGQGDKIPQAGQPKKKKKNANPETPELYLWIHVWVFRTANAESKTQTIFILTDIAKTCTNL